LVEKTAAVLASKTDRRGMLVRSAIVGSALAAHPTDFIFKPVSAYAATTTACACKGQACDCGSACCDGYTEFCCTLTGNNTCPGGTFPGGWWKADGSGLCNGGPRYYIDCNVVPGQNPCSCGCALGDCNQRASCCNVFRYGQCHQEIPGTTSIMCRVVTCTAPWVFDPTCTMDVAVDDDTRFHDAPCLHEPAPPKTKLETAQWFLRNTPSAGYSDISFLYGQAGDVPVVGDWDGDGVATPGVFRDGTWYLRNSNSPGNADIVVQFGNPGDIPIVGDWNGDGSDSIGIVRGNTFYLRNTNTSGYADTVFAFGNAGDTPIVGKWKKWMQGDSVGVVRNGTFYLRNPNTGNAVVVFSYGDPGERVIVGDWNGDGIDTPCVVRNGTFYVRNSNSAGYADVVFSYGDPSDIPLVGRWTPGVAKNQGPAVAR
jgi:hypothetical protein